MTFFGTMLLGCVSILSVVEDYASTDLEFAAFFGSLFLATLVTCILFRDEEEPLRLGYRARRAAIVAAVVLLLIQPILGRNEPVAWTRFVLFGTVAFFHGFWGLFRIQWSD